MLPIWRFRWLTIYMHESGKTRILSVELFGRWHGGRRVPPSGAAKTGPFQPVTIFPPVPEAAENARACFLWARSGFGPPVISPARAELESSQVPWSPVPCRWSLSLNGLPFGRESLSAAPALTASRPSRHVGRDDYDHLFAALFGRR